MGEGAAASLDPLSLLRGEEGGVGGVVLGSAEIRAVVPKRLGTAALAAAGLQRSGGARRPVSPQLPAPAPNYSSEM